MKLFGLEPNDYAAGLAIWAALISLGVAAVLLLNYVIPEWQ